MPLAVLALACGKDRASAGGGRSKGREPRVASAAAQPSGAEPAGLPAKAPSGVRPNVVLILTDDQRADSLACMPKLTKLLPSAVTFANAFATTPLCCPSRSSILTGLYAHNHGVRQNGDTEDGDETRTPGAEDFTKSGNHDRNLAKWLQGSGYRTGYVGKYLNGYDKVLKRSGKAERRDRKRGQGGSDEVPPHWDDWYAFPHAEYYDFQLVERPKGAAAAKRVCYRSSRGQERKGARACEEDADEVRNDGTESYSTDVLRDRAVAFIRSAAASKQPFFLQFAVKAPHGPFDSPLRYQPDLRKAEFTPEAVERLGACPLFDWKGRPANVLEKDVSDKPEWVQRLAGKSTPAEVDRIRRKQLVSMLAVEDAVEALLRALDETGARARTAVVYLGDNGYSWGEHGYTAKNCAYEACIRVPLMIAAPRHEGPGTVAAMVANVDMAPTVLALTGVSAPSGTKLDGLSLVPLLDAPSAPWPRKELLVECWGTASVGRPDVHAAVRTERFKYVEHYEGDDMARVQRRKDGRAELELYDLSRDPHELDNLLALPPAELALRGTSKADADAVAKNLAGKLAKLRKD